jgi:5-methylcytosine-specific restriction endonuclease McrA
MLCSVEGCERPSRRRGLCGSHSQRLYRTGELGTSDFHTPGSIATCSYGNCNKPYKAKGMCEQHYQAWSYQRSREQRLACIAVYKKAHPEVAKAAQRKWLANHPEERRDIEAFYSASYYGRLANREKNRRRRARLAGLIVTPVEYAAILQREGMICHLCKGEISSLDDLDFDHVVPLARGGEHVASNLAPSHSHCNRSKGARR